MHLIAAYCFDSSGELVFRGDADAGPRQGIQDENRRRTPAVGEWLRAVDAKGSRYLKKRIGSSPNRRPKTFNRTRGEWPRQEWAAKDSRDAVYPRGCLLLQAEPSLASWPE